MIVLNKHRDVIPAGAVYIGRGSPLGNPYSHMAGTSARYRVATRSEAIERYRRYLYAEIKAQNRAILRALDELNANSVLWCFCAPLPCHGDVVIRAWEWLHRREAEVVQGLLPLRLTG